MEEWKAPILSEPPIPGGCIGRLLDNGSILPYSEIVGAVSLGIKKSMEGNRFRRTLENKEFVYTLELVPGRGARGKVLEEVMIIAEKAIRGNLIHALTASAEDLPKGGARFIRGKRNVSRSELMTGSDPMEKKKPLRKAIFPPATGT